jgi:hypothetical protein
MPPAEFNVSPGGKDPAYSDHAYGVRSPEAVNDCEYATLAVADGRDAVVIVNTPAGAVELIWALNPPPLLVAAA